MVKVNPPARVKRFLGFGVLVVLGAVWLAIPAAAAGLQVTLNRFVSNFPDRLTFDVAAQSEANINQVTLLYGTDGRTCQAGTARQAIDLTPAPAIEASWDWELRRSGSLPPGARVWWQWELSDAAGARMVTEQTWDTLRDERFTWQTLQQGDVTVLWVEGDRAFARALLRLAQASLDRLSAELGVSAPGPIQLVIYPTTEDLLSALVYPADWTGGVAFPAYNITLIGIAPDQLDWAAQVIPHELTHLVVGVRVFNCRGLGLPTWLDEGLAMVGEGADSGRGLDAVKEALAAGQLGQLSSLASGFQVEGDLARLSYDYSGEIVAYLLAEHGPEKLQALLDAIQSGQKAETALQATYGFDTDGLDAAWRASVGLDAAVNAAPTAAATRTAVPTFAMWTATAPPTATPSATLAASPTPPPSATPEIPAVTPTPPSAAPPAAALGPWLGAGLGLLVIAALAAWFVLRRLKGSP